MPQRGVESSFPLIALINPDQMVCVLKVKFGEDPGWMELAKSGVEKGEWVLIFRGDVRGGESRPSG